MHNILAQSIGQKQLKNSLDKQRIDDKRLIQDLKALAILSPIV